MKKILLMAFSILVFSAYANTTKQSAYVKEIDYESESIFPIKVKEQMEKCDTDMNNKQENDKMYQNTIGIGISVGENVECHINIAKEIIKTAFSKSQEKMENNLDSFIASALKVSGDRQYPDSCIDTHCGTAAGIRAVSAQLAILKLYIEQLANYD